MPNNNRTRARPFLSLGKQMITLVIRQQQIPRCQTQNLAQEAAEIGLNGGSGERAAIPKQIPLTKIGKSAHTMRL